LLHPLPRPFAPAACIVPAAIEPVAAMTMKTRKPAAAWNRPAGSATTSQIAQLREMGFAEKQARDALAECVWDVNKALDLLVTRAAANAVSTESAKPKSPRLDNPFPRSGENKVVAWPRPAKAERSTSSNSDRGDLENSTTASTASSPRSPGLSSESVMHLPQERASAPVLSNTAAADDTVHLLKKDAATGSTASSPRSSGQSEKSSTDMSQHIASSPVPSGTAAADDILHFQREVSDTSMTDAATARVCGSTCASICNSTETPAAETADLECIEADAAPPPRKQLRQVLQPWGSEGAEFAAREGNLVRVWADSETPHGWIYAEELDDGSRAGWLPSCVLEPLLSHEQWMMVHKTMDAIHETQLSVREKSWLKVNVTSRTEEGWAYAEVACSGQAGWVPVCCLDWVN